MSFFSSVERAVLPFVTRVQDMIGKVIYDYTGVASNDYVNQAVFYIVGWLSPHARGHMPSLGPHCC